MDDRDELLEKIERAARNADDEELDIPVVNEIVGLFNRARTYGVIRYPVPA